MEDALDAAVAERSCGSLRQRSDAIAEAERSSRKATEAWLALEGATIAADEALKEADAEAEGEAEQTQKEAHAKAQKQAEAEAEETARKEAEEAAAREEVEAEAQAKQEEAARKKEEKRAADEAKKVEAARRKAEVKAQKKAEAGEAIGKEAEEVEAEADDEARQEEAARKREEKRAYDEAKKVEAARKKAKAKAQEELEEEEARQEAEADGEVTAWNGAEIKRMLMADATERAARGSRAKEQGERNIKMLSGLATNFTAIDDYELEEEGPSPPRICASRDRSGEASRITHSGSKKQGTSRMLPPPSRQPLRPSKRPMQADDQQDGDVLSRFSGEETSVITITPVRRVTAHMPRDEHSTSAPIPKKLRLDSVAVSLKRSHEELSGSRSESQQIKTLRVHFESMASKVAAVQLKHEQDKCGDAYKALDADSTKATSQMQKQMVSSSRVALTPYCKAHALRN